MGKKGQKIIYTDPASTPVVQSKEIRWPQQVDQKHFPEYWELTSKTNPLWYGSNHCTSEVLEDFYNALIRANDTVRIIDKNFIQVNKKVNPELIGPHLLFKAVKKSHFQNLKIITIEQKNSNGSVAKLMEKELQKQRKPGGPRDKLTVKILALARNDLKHIHDRFAIVDQVLWHFGSDVGGKDPNLNAVSFGWDAQETGAITFFENLWEELIYRGRGVV